MKPLLLLYIFGVAFTTGLTVPPNNFSDTISYLISIITADSTGLSALSQSAANKVISYLNNLLATLGSNPNNPTVILQTVNATNSQIAAQIQALVSGGDNSTGVVALEGDFYGAEGLLSATAFVIIDAIRCQSIIPLPAIIAISGTAYTTAHDNLIIALIFELIRINTLKANGQNESETDEQKFKNLAQTMVGIQQIRLKELNQKIILSIWGINVFGDVNLKNELLELQADAQQCLDLSESFLSSNPYDGPIDEPTVQACHDKLVAILAQINKLLYCFQTNDLICLQINCSSGPYC